MNKAKLKIAIRIVALMAIVIAFLVVGVYAVKNDLVAYTVVHADGHESVVLSGNTSVEQILKDGGIMVLADEVTTPSLNDNINFTQKIVINKASEVENSIVAEQVDVAKEEILNKYITIKEVIVTEQEEIPFETVTKDVSTDGNDTEDKVLQEGENGIKEIKYRIRYQNNVEISREKISEEIIQEPQERIIQISNKVISRAAPARTGGGSSSLAQSVEGQTPRVVTLNASAYAGDTSTASGARPQAMFTVAAGRSIPFGTVIYIPYFENYSNGGWFVVQDRGGAITDGKIDIYMSSESQCNSFGRRNLECYIYD